VAVTSNVGVERLFDALDRLSAPQQATNIAGFQATKVAGHPLYISWGFYLGSEVTANGSTKVFFFLPYLPVGSQPIRKITGASAIESPLEMIMATSNPYNLKATFPNNLDIRKLVERQFYFFSLAMLPAAVSNKGEKANPYSDCHLKSFGLSPNEVCKDIFALFQQTSKDWESMQLTQIEQQHNVSHDAPASDQ
jgi:hypothetical protein